MISVGYFVDTVREPIPPLPWSVEPYGYSLASIKSGGETIVETLNIAVAEFIVAAVNKENNG